MGESIRTVDHDVVREWVTARGGIPAVVAATHEVSGSGDLRVDFGEPEEGLEQVSWEEFFRIFDSNNLAFLYQEETADGVMSFFCKFVSRIDEAEEEPEDIVDEAAAEMSDGSDEI